MRHRNFIATGLLVVSIPAIAQTAPLAATASTVVPALVPYSGVALHGDGKPQTGESSVTFLIFKDETGGEPLWVETQKVAFDPAGHYAVHLGAANPSGLPTNLFATGEARWLEVQVAGAAPQPRVLLATVPYAMKAADAATLGGLPASAFVLAGSVSNVPAIVATGNAPDASSTVTTTGGASHYIPIFTGTNSIGNSQIYDAGTGVGIGDIPNKFAKLDVNGEMIMRGNMQVTRTGNATSSKGFPSYGFQFYSSAYNSSTKALDNPFFSLQSEPTGNNTSSPSATFNLLFSNNGAAPAETGLSINSSGVIKFASGQTFDSTSSNVTALFGTSTSGDGVDGSTTSGVGVRGYSGSGFGVSGTSDNSNGVNGLIPGNTLNTAGVYGVAGVASGVGGGIAGVWGDAYSHVGVLGSSYQYAGIQGISNNGPGVNGILASASQEGQSHSFPSGMWGNTSSPGGVAVLGTADNANGGVYYNNSSDYATLYIDNDTYSSTGIIFEAEALAHNAACFIYLDGSLSCSGGVSSIARVNDGARQVQTYAMQSAENWYEDAGTAKLVKGVAHVDLEPIFGQVVNASVDYHVFLTPNGDCKGLYVSAKSANGFEVHELSGGNSSIAFDYRIMAKRAGHENERLVDVTERLKKQAALHTKRTSLKQQPLVSQSLGQPNSLPR